MTLVRGLPSAEPAGSHRPAGSSLYSSDGKQAFRELLLAIAVQDELRTFGTFWGTGIDSRLMSAAGLDVLAAELSRAKHELLANDAELHGYRAHAGRASRLREHFDMFHADFDGGPSPMNFREVRKIAAITDRWLAVTLSMDHLRDESMMGEAAAYTIPAWLTGASGFTLEYLGRYKRNRFGQMMWVALLQHRDGRGNSHRVQPLQIEWSLADRGYWASRAMYRHGLLPHRQEPRTVQVRRSDAARYQRKRAMIPPRLIHCRQCGKSLLIKRPRGRPPTTCSAECRREARRRYHHEWYVAAVQSTAAEAQIAA